VFVCVLVLVLVLPMLLQLWNSRSISSDIRTNLVRLFSRRQLVLEEHLGRVRVLCYLSALLKHVKFGKLRDIIP
jgi:hypothetical protein